MTSLSHRKKALRRRAIALRDAAARDRTAAAQRLTHGFAEVPVPPRSVVSGFCPFGSEIDVMPLLDRLRAMGHEIVLPVVVERGAPLVFRRWRPRDPMAKGPFGIPQPREDAPEMTPEVLLVPMLAFDRSGYRLGYGGGYYDRTLAALRAAGRVLAVGIAYAAQEVPSVPHGPRDERLDWIATDAGAWSAVRGGEDAGP